MAERTRTGGLLKPGELAGGKRCKCEVLKVLKVCGGGGVCCGGGGAGGGWWRW